MKKESWCFVEKSPTATNKTKEEKETGYDDPTDNLRSAITEQQKIPTVEMETVEWKNDDDDDDRKNIDTDRLKEFQKAFEDDPSARVAQNATTEAKSVEDLTLRRDLMQASTGGQETALSPYFSINLDHGGMPATNQKDSGRCWMFGTLNLFRFGTREKLGLDDFEFSESYLYFYYLLEQANWFLEYILETADRPLDDRVLHSMLHDPVDDGGDWVYAVHLLNKYGIVPKQVYPESYSSSHTDELATTLCRRLTAAAARIRDATATEASAMANRDVCPRSLKWECIQECYRILCIHLGTPPSPTFDWKWRDDTQEGKLHRLDGMAPQEFAKTYITLPYQTYVAIIQDPRHEYYRRYQVDHAMNMVNGPPVIFLNLPADEMKDIAVRMIRDGAHPVFFACNVGVECNDKYGLWSADLYERSSFYGVNPSYDWKGMSKADQIQYGGTMGTHVMLITGVDVDPSKEDSDTPIRWRVENSWGTDGAGVDGYYTMMDDWFNKQIYEIVAPPEYLSDKAKEGMKLDPILLPAWDPMCTAAKRGGRKGQRRR